MESAEAGLKESAIKHFAAKASLYAERYVVQASGDVLQPRHRAILQMVHEVKLPQGSRILDLGCGPGALSFDLAKRGYRGVGLDAAPAMVQRSRLRAAAEGLSGLWRYQLGDVEALPFRNECFDAAVCAGVIEYLPRDEHMLREAARVTASDPTFVNALGTVQTPVQYLDAPEFQRFWEADAKTLSTAVQRVGKLE